MRINQINGRGGDVTRTKLKKRVGAVVRDHGFSKQLLRRVISETALDLLAKKAEKVEDRRVLWTMYENIKLWFENWARDLVELGFATEHAGEIDISEEQLARILNLDEMCLSLDGSNGARGGRPEVVFFDPRLPQTGKPTSKTGVTTTMITGSNAIGEALPPHFQF